MCIDTNQCVDAKRFLFFDAKIFILGTDQRDEDFRPSDWFVQYKWLCYDN